MQEVHFFQNMMGFMHSNLRRLDLNLLLALDALFRHRSVTAAADELAMSPSALSHALARLREVLADDLFVRVGNAMQPTGYAERLAEPVAAGLEIFSRGLAMSGSFDPASSDRVFVLAATDYTAFAVLPRLMARMQDVAPGLGFKTVYSSGRESAEELASGRIDFALGYVDEAMEPTPGIESFTWLEDDYVVIASRRHPLIRGGLDLDQYLAARHVVVTPWNEATGFVDKVLDRQGLQRQVAVQLPSVLAAPFIVAQSALIMTVPRYAAKILQESADIAIYPAPFPLPRYTLKAYGHIKHNRTAAHVWMREQLLAVVPSTGGDGDTHAKNGL
ncbi:transcriptional regulator, LysR family [Rhodoferax sp. OV413]|nr:transcriptional regulator, LysR family [Rhodoferax sp. OV413]